MTTNIDPAPWITAAALAAFRRTWVFHVDIDGAGKEFEETFVDRWKTEYAEWQEARLQRLEDAEDGCNISVGGFMSQNPTTMTTNSEQHAKEIAAQVDFNPYSECLTREAIAAVVQPLLDAQSRAVEQYKSYATMLEDRLQKTKEELEEWRDEIMQDEILAMDKENIGLREWRDAFGDGAVGINKLATEIVEGRLEIADLKERLRTVEARVNPDMTNAQYHKQMAKLWAVVPPTATTYPTVFDAVVAEIQDLQAERQRLEAELRGDV